VASLSEGAGEEEAGSEEPEEVMGERARTLLVGLQGMLVGLGAGIHIGHYVTRRAGPDSAPQSDVLIAGWACYMFAFGLLALRAFTQPPPRPPAPSD
jgi:hypothetical protein